MNIRFHYDRPIEEVGIITPSTGKIWFEDLVGGLKPIEKDKLPDGAAFGFEMASFVLDVQRYLPWYDWISYLKLTSLLMVVGYRWKLTPVELKYIERSSLTSVRSSVCTLKHRRCSIVQDWVHLRSVALRTRCYILRGYESSTGLL